ncbi:alpha/beta hydrolase [Micromonospora sp. DR5-3]|uniref:alpha/beta hydrolase family protein n=1 Tax=unclassified Micromonospora TaxID=2617518 RepID=UPI0011D575DB|nr:MULTISPECIES: alpha/beta hydrolase [unclassified Micromonospora]MCW3814845.1 alpha/beta hydrolase [Micromonospora sp. DR5-3]TYC24163.1 alpha/beta hydrolase [Micromonospora sp. MP36]
MRVQRLVAALVTALLVGCAPASATTRGPTSPASRPAPQGMYPVGVRQFVVDPGGPRPLPVTVWYPAESPAPSTPTASATDPLWARTGAGGPSVRAGARVATGRFPVVIYSHGLRSLPELHAPLTARWAAAGFVVAAPAFPRTNLRARDFTRADVRNQPADGWRLIRHLVRLDTRRGDPFAGRLAVNRIAAAGHSAGGFTTAGMFTSGHSARLRSGIVLAGGGLAGSFAGPVAPLLFVHGTADPVVPESVGRAAYARALGPAAFLSLRGQGHGEYLIPGHPGFPQVLATTIDFLRWTLYDDAAALHRLPTDARLPGLTTLTSRLPR